LKKRERENADARSNSVVIFLLAKNGNLQWLTAHTTMINALINVSNIHHNSEIEKNNNRGMSKEQMRN
jgi:hypothetical protein